MEAIDYDKNGKILDSRSRNYFDWQRIIPISYGENMYDAAWARVRGKLKNLTVGLQIKPVV